MAIPDSGMKMHQGCELDEILSHNRSFVANKEREYPLMPPRVPVHGLVVDPETGELTVIVDGDQHSSIRKRETSRI